jgi:actin-like ATPase involved in cell morphogenesis
VTYGLGVDLGTSFVAAAIGEAGRTRIVMLGDDSALAPALVRVRPDGSLVSGQAAAWGPEDPALLVRNVKRRLGDPNSLILAGRTYSAAGLLAVMLADVVKVATEQEGAPPAHVVLTCPAVWGPYRREHFEEVARRAGLRAVTLLTEPEAAARHQPSHAPSRPPSPPLSGPPSSPLSGPPSRPRSRGPIPTGPGVLSAVYDLGGGTFDTAVVRATPAGPELTGVPEGLEWVGGIDFDDALLAWVDQELGGAVSALNPGDVAAEQALSRIRRACVGAKEALSRDERTNIVALLPNRATDLSITRAEYEDLIRTPLEATLQALERTVASTGRAPSDLAGILLAGGSSRIPLVARMLAGRFGCPVLAPPQPKLGVALGAAGLAGEILARSERPERATRPTRSERATRSERSERSERATRSERPERSVTPGPGNADRPSSPGRPVRTATPNESRRTAAPTESRPPARRRRRRRGVVAGVALALVAVAVAAGAGLAVGRRQPQHRADSGPDSGPAATSSAGPSTPLAPAPSATPVTTSSVAADAAISAAVWYHVVNVHSGKCVSGPDSGAGSGSPSPQVVQESCSASDAERWRFTPSGSGTFRVVNASGGLVWTVVGPAGDDGTSIKLRPWSHEAVQQWTVVPVPAGRFRFVVLGSGKCLDLSSDSKAAGAWIQQWYCDETPNQDYELQPL